MIYNRVIQIIIWSRPYAKYLLAAWIIAILTVSSIPSLPTVKIHTAKTDIRLDYLIHFVEYGILAFMAFLSFTGRDFRLNRRKFVLISLGLIAFAMIDEFHQKLIPGRTFNPKDIYSNISGIVAAIIYCTIIFRKISGKENKDAEAFEQDH